MSINRQANIHIILYMLEAIKSSNMRCIRKLVITLTGGENEEKTIVIIKLTRSKFKATLTKIHWINKMKKTKEKQISFKVNLQDDLLNQKTGKETKNTTKTKKNKK